MSLHLAPLFRQLPGPLPNHGDNFLGREMVEVGAGDNGEVYSCR